jgi:pyruvate formate lyase activating enzyme
MQQWTSANIDLKGFTGDFYVKLTGGYLQSVLKTLAYVHHNTDCWLEIAALLIPGRKDSEAEIKALSTCVANELGPEVPLRCSAFHPDWKMEDVPPTTPSTLSKARIALDMYPHYIYTGNVHDAVGGTISCPKCHHATIARDRYDIRYYYLASQGSYLEYATKNCRTFRKIQKTVWSTPNSGLHTGGEIMINTRRIQ